MAADGQQGTSSSTTCWRLLLGDGCVSSTELGRPTLRASATPRPQIPAQALEPNATNPLGMDPMLLAAAYYASMATELEGEQPDQGGMGGISPAPSHTPVHSPFRPPASCQPCTHHAPAARAPAPCPKRHRPALPLSQTPPGCRSQPPWAALSRTCTETTWWTLARPPVSFPEVSPTGQADNAGWASAGQGQPKLHKRSLPTLTFLD